LRLLKLAVEELDQQNDFHWWTFKGNTLICYELGDPDEIDAKDKVVAKFSVSITPLK
jgi:hypothetical protein